MIKSEDGKTLIAGSGKEVFGDLVAINIAFLNLMKRTGNTDEQANAALTAAVFHAVEHREAGQTVKHDITLRPATDTEKDKEE